MVSTKSDSALYPNMINRCTWEEKDQNYIDLHQLLNYLSQVEIR